VAGRAYEVPALTAALAESVETFARELDLRRDGAPLVAVPAGDYVALGESSTEGADVVVGWLIGGASADDGVTFLPSLAPPTVDAALLEALARLEARFASLGSNAAPRTPDGVWLLGCGGLATAQLVFGVASGQPRKKAAGLTWVAPVTQEQEEASEGVLGLPLARAHGYRAFAVDLSKSALTEHGTKTKTLKGTPAYALIAQYDAGG
jgi:hypothetical protein